MSFLLNPASAYQQSLHSVTDPFFYDAEYQILCCKLCQSAVAPHGSLRYHLTAHHSKIWSRPFKTAILAAHEPELAQCLSTTERRVRAVDPYISRIPHLPYEANAFACLLCDQDDHQRLITPSRGSLRHHINAVHNGGTDQTSDVPETRLNQRYDHLTVHEYTGRTDLDEPPGRTYLNELSRRVACQTFFTCSRYRRWFEVERPRHTRNDRQARPSVDRLDAGPDPSSADVDGRLRLSSIPLPSSLFRVTRHDSTSSIFAYLDDRKAIEARRVDDEAAHYTRVDPWGGRTHWPEYLRGYQLRSCAALLDPPVGDRDAPLTLLHDSLNRNIDAARQMILGDGQSRPQVNEWTLRLINSFSPGIGWKIPLQVALLKPTWTKYIAVWKKLFSYLWRLEIRAAQPHPIYRLTDNQRDELEQCVRFTTVIGQQRQRGQDFENTYAHLDEHVLKLCIALLDHQLEGDPFDSVVVSFFAVLAIDVDLKGFQGPANYTNKMSGFIKLAQMFVVQWAIIGSRQGSYCISPSVAIEQMHDRFMHGQCGSPFAEALRLRTLGNKIRDNMTDLGKIRWSDHGENLTYLDVTIEIPRFRTFIHTQIRIAQTLLAQLITIDPRERQTFQTPRILLSLLRDRPIESRRDYCYLDHPVSQIHCPSNIGDLLLRRLLDSDTLRQIFLIDPDRAEVGSAWNFQAVCNYIDKIDRFLEHLLLLIHITSGQPGRSTEILSLQLRNSTATALRNVFIDPDGLIHLVSYWCKQYHTTALPKLIHRYLPRQVGELLVYYQTLILPFRDQLLQLAMGWTKRPEPYLWTSLDPARPGPWDKNRLSAVLKREVGTHLGIKYNVQINRHVMIAISRFKQGRTGGFKRPYQTTTAENVRDRQAAHSSHTAGHIYARHIDAGDRWLEAQAWQFKQVSDEWHNFWGFGEWDTTLDLTDTTQISFRAAILPTARAIERSIISISDPIPRASKRKIREIQTATTATAIITKSSRRVRKRRLISSSPSLSSHHDATEVESDGEKNDRSLSERETGSQIEIDITAAEPVSAASSKIEIETARVDSNRTYRNLPKIQIVITERGWNRKIRSAKIS